MSFPFLDGALLALTIVTSVGPVSLKCIFNGLALGRRAVMVTGLGGGTAHGIFAAVAGTGAGAVGTMIANHNEGVRLTSALMLLGLGIRVMLKQVPAQAERQGGGLHAAYLSTALVALANPLTLVPYAAAAPALATVAFAEPTAVVLLAAGAASAATLWYLTIGCLATVVPRKLVASLLPRLNLVAGLSQVGFALLIYLR